MNITLSRIRVPILNVNMVNTFSAQSLIRKMLLFYAGPPKEDIFPGHLLSPIFQFIITHYIYRFMPILGYVGLESSKQGYQMAIPLGMVARWSRCSCKYMHTPRPKRHGYI